MQAEFELLPLGTFDTLNPFTLKGIAAAGLGQVFDTLMVAAGDEPFTEYGLVAETVEVPADKSWVTFTRRPGARFPNGRRITVEDVIWTFETLKARGHPFYRSYYRHVAQAERAGPRGGALHVHGRDQSRAAANRGQMPVLSKAWWTGRNFDATTLDVPLGCGPYRVERVEPGRSITYRRVADYWAAGLLVNAGRFNFDLIRYEYHRDRTVALEAFKGGLYDFRVENSAKDGATAYDVPAVRERRIRMEEIPHQLPTGMQGFVYNTRRELFADRRVRRALAYAFDFEWTNTYLFYGACRRTESHFSNSELAARGLPGPAEFEARAVPRAGRPRGVHGGLPRAFHRTGRAASQPAGGVATRARSRRRSRVPKAPGPGPTRAG